MGRREGSAVALHRSRQTAAERIHRELQRQPAGRVAERGNLRQPGRRTTKAGPLALRLQHGPAPLVPGKPDAAASAPDA